MPIYVGIDLGTTNSAICTFDGESVRVYKSPDQNDVTPSAIYNDGRRKYVGKRAYDLAPSAPESTARLFKRLMGTKTPIRLKGHEEPLTPEACSAEVLKTMFGYLPAEVRAEVVGTVVTVPAAFNQMQKNATLEAAELAGIGAVALMQEPVAAVMSVMRARSIDGIFVVYDLGGGTLDVAVAESTGGRVNLLGHGGIEMCGGRDWDKAIVDSVVRPWLGSEFNLPEAFRSDERYRSLMPLAEWAAEKAKIEVASQGESIIGLTEAEVRLKDLSGDEIFLDVPLSSKDIDHLISEQIDRSIEAVRETLENAHIPLTDVNRIVFVGGPTQYKHVRDRVSNEVAVSSAMDVNPMTAVAEGAAIFAESIDWASAKRGRKSNRASLDTGNLNISLNYISRTPSSTSRIAIKIEGELPEGSEFQIDSQDTGWSSGRLPLRREGTIELTLSKQGDNVFKVLLFAGDGSAIPLKDDRVVIARTAATIDAIPASHSVGVEVLDRLGGQPVMEWLIRKGESLPKKGTQKFRAGETLRAGAPHAITFKLWEGELSDPPSDNQFVGSIKISGSDLESGVIAHGSELVCDYEISDAGVITMEISATDVGASFGAGHNFYSRQDGAHDFEDSRHVVEEAARLSERIDMLKKRVDDPSLHEAGAIARKTEALDPDAATADEAKHAMQDLGRAKKLLSQARKRHLSLVREADLDSCEALFEDECREHAKASEISRFENAARTARRALTRPDSEFDQLLGQMKGINWDVLWRQDWFVIEHFKRLISRPSQFVDPIAVKALAGAGSKAIEQDDIDSLKGVVLELYRIKVSVGSEDDAFGGVNILRG